VKRGGTAILLVLAAALLLTLAESRCHADRIMRVGDRQPISFARMAEEIKGARLIFVGEKHDRKADHRFQLEVITALKRAGVPIAIGLEMFTAGNQGDLDRWVAGKLDQERFIASYYRNWGMVWPLYRDIFLYARTDGIPLVGINVSREIPRKVAREGFAALTPTERRELPADITCDVSPAYMALIRRAYAAHMGSDDSFTRFCEAQMLWNKTMAWHVAGYLRSHPGVCMVVLAGSGHAMKPGIPEEVRRETGIVAKVILPEDEGFSRETVTESDADYLFEAP
jgi:uncharacterized iron-regulated protein